LSLDYATLDLLRQNHPAWRLLRSDHAPLIASFLHRVFVAPNVRLMAQADLVEALEDELFGLRERLGPSAFPKPAREYLNDWAANDKGWLRKFYRPGSDEPHFDLTPATEKAIAWLGTLTARAFVGTESRLLTLFALLEQMSEGSEADPEARLAEIDRRRTELDAEQARILGTNLVPDEVWVDTLDDALALIGKGRDARHFGAIVALTQKRQPAALSWVARHPLKALEVAGHWPLLLDTVAWICTHPRPGVYLRQIDVPGVHTKLIEANRTVLAEILDLSLAGEAIDARYAGVAQFCRRYGFRDKPARVRFRVLDPRRALLAPGTDQDITVNADAFARLDLPVERVFVTENEINFLAFPPLVESLVVFGAGYGFDNLTRATWLQRCAVRYWGDIDTHGFAILDELRELLPHAQSFLMDRETLLQHASLWVDEPQPLRRDLPRLRPAEQALFDDLRHDRIRPALRLEQERIGFRWVETALARLP